MAKSKQQKQDIIKKLTDGFCNSKSVMFVNFSGTCVADVTELRRKCREEKTEYIVAKKSLLQIACENCKVDINPRKFEGEVATVFSKEDEVAPAKVLHNFAKEHQQIKFIGGILENKFIEPEVVSDLAKLPSKQELYAKIVGSIKAPVSGFVNVLGGNLRNLVGVLNAIKESKA